MIWLIFVLVGIVAIVISFYSSIWCWLILAIPELYLSIIFWSSKSKKYKILDNLDDSANLLFQKYSYYFLHQYAARDFSGSAALMLNAGIIIGFINIFYGFYYGIGLAVISYFLMKKISNEINPYYNVWNDHDREMSKQIFKKLYEQAKK